MKELPLSHLRIHLQLSNPEQLALSGMEWLYLVRHLTTRFRSSSRPVRPTKSIVGVGEPPLYVRPFLRRADGRIFSTTIMQARSSFYPALAVVLFLGSFASSTSIADGANFEQLEATTSHSLLEARKSCPISFEFKNYTIITSRCKGPEYPADKCCKAFKEFACPYAHELNDLTNDCASTMFSYINLYGHYPAGLFASKCREGKKGFTCPASAPAASADDNGAHT